jgi:hypothetical protein
VTRTYSFDPSHKFSYFNPIKRLPRPDSSAKRRPAPLRLYQSDDHTTSTSTFPSSKPLFPQPPQNSALSEDQLRFSSPPIVEIAHDEQAQLAPTASPSIRFSGVSFEIVNPHRSIDIAEVDTPSEEVKELPSHFLDLPDYDSDEDEMESQDGFHDRPKAKRFSSVQAAFESVTNRFRPSRSSSRSSTRDYQDSGCPSIPPRPQTVPLPTPSATTPLQVRFRNLGQRMDAHGVPVTSSIDAGPSAGQTHFSNPSLALSKPSPVVHQSIRQTEPVYTSNVPLPLPAYSNAQLSTPTDVPSLPLTFQAPASSLSSEHRLQSSQERRVGTASPGDGHRNVQYRPMSNPRSAVVEGIARQEAHRLSLSPTAYPSDTASQPLGNLSSTTQPPVPGPEPAHLPACKHYQSEVYQTSC